MRVPTLALLALLLLPFPSAVSWGQNPPVPLPFPQHHAGPGEDATPDEEAARREKEMEKKANEERQAQLKRDTDKLFLLSTQLKQYVDKTNENILSLDVIKKADEIEKLAHSVKEKMKGSN